MVKPEGTVKPAARPSSKPAPKPAPPMLTTPVDVYVLLMSSATQDGFYVHRQGCKGYAPQKKKSAYAGTDDYALAEIANQREVIMEVWDDQIRESWGDDPDNEQDSDYASASWLWLENNGYVDSVTFHSCLDGLPEQPPQKVQKVQKNGTAAKAAATRKIAKNELASLVAEASGAMLRSLLGTADIADATEGTAQQTDHPLPLAPSPEPDRIALVRSGFRDDEAIRQCVAQWLHGIPADRTRFLAALPRPDRSDWREQEEQTEQTEQTEERQTTAPEQETEERQTTAPEQETEERQTTAPEQETEEQGEQTASE
jgi:hypothetical protein